MESKRVVSGQCENPKVAECLIEQVETPAKAVLVAVSTIRNRPIVHLDCLFDAVDPDALNTLITGSPNASVAIHFEYEGCSVEVTGDRVRATELDLV